MIECIECKFWVSHEASDMGDCRRHAPTLVRAMAPQDESADEMRWAFWPETWAEHGCGDGVAK